MQERISIAAAVLLLGLFAVLAGGAAMRESTTVDEVAHIGAGISYLQKLDLRLNPEHPPLGKVIAAGPLVVRGVRADYSSPAWTASGSVFPAFFGEWVFGDWVLHRWNDTRSTLLWARVPMLLLTVLLGAVVYVYAYRLGGPWGALLCVAVFASTPAFLTFGPLVITDIPVALFSVIAVWQMGELWRNPTRRNSILFGASIAAAMLSKFTAAILIVVIVVFAIQTRIWPLPVEPTAKPERRVWRRARWRATFVAIGWAAAIVYAFYLVLSWNQPNDAVDRVPWIALRRLLMPAWLYVRGLLFMLMMSNRPTFILGQSHPHGVIFYFPVLVLLKSPLGFLGLLALGTGAVVLRRWLPKTAVIPDEFRVHWRALCVGLGVFTGVCLLSPLNISIRHFTIPLAMMILLLAPLPRLLASFSRPVAWQAAAAGLAMSCVWTAIVAYPHFFPYLNSLAFGRPAYTLVNDSNVDWNHALYYVKDFADRRGLQPVKVDILSLTDPAPVVPGAEIWDCQAPSEADAGRWTIVAATMLFENHNCKWLLRYPHEVLAGGSVYAFQLPKPIPAPGAPGGPPLVSERKMLFGGTYEPRTMFQELSRHPEQIAPTMERMMREYEEQQRKQKK